MMKKISRKIFVSREDKRLGQQYLKLSYYWIDLADKAKEDNNEFYQTRCLKNSAIYLNKAVKYLGFKTAEDMHAYYEKHKRF